jgi:hypothetical protein
VAGLSILASVPPFEIPGPGDVAELDDAGDAFGGREDDLWDLDGPGDLDDLDDDFDDLGDDFDGAGHDLGVLQRVDGHDDLDGVDALHHLDGGVGVGVGALPEFDRFDDPDRSVALGGGAGVDADQPGLDLELVLDVPADDVVPTVPGDDPLLPGSVLSEVPLPEPEPPDEPADM